MLALNFSEKNIFSGDFNVDFLKIENPVSEFVDDSSNRLTSLC